MLKVLEIRKRQEMSQGTLAKKVGIEQGSLCDIERALTFSSVSRLLWSARWMSLWTWTRIAPLPN